MKARRKGDDAIGLVGCVCVMSNQGKSSRRNRSFFARARVMEYAYSISISILFYSRGIKTWSHHSIHAEKERENAELEGQRTKSLLILPPKKYKDKSS